MLNLQVCDGTFNLLANGSPTLVLGTLDWDHKFRLEGIGYTSHHDEEAFTALYKSAAAGIALIAPGRTLKGDYTMQDGAREISIFNASTNVLAPCKGHWELFVSCCPGNRKQESRVFK